MLLVAALGAIYMVLLPIAHPLVLNILAALIVGRIVYLMGEL